jgi:hypothetical protein
MVVARAIGSLSQQLDETFRAVDALQRAAGDAPPAPKIVLPRIVAESADTIQGWLADGHEAADRAERAARPGAVDLDALRAALGDVRLAAKRVQETLRELFSYERQQHLATVGRDLGGEWPGWARAVCESLELCREQHDALVDTLFACWQDVSVWTATATSPHATLEEVGGTTR